MRKTALQQANAVDFAERRKGSRQRARTHPYVSVCFSSKAFVVKQYYVALQMEHAVF